MVKMPAAVEKAEKLVKEAITMHGRLRNGQRHLEQALNNQSVTDALTIVELFNRLSGQLINLTEELIVLHQLHLLGHDLYVRRDGAAIFASRMAEGEVELDPYYLLSLQALTQTFGPLPPDFVNIKD